LSENDVIEQECNNFISAWLRLLDEATSRVVAIDAVLDLPANALATSRVWCARMFHPSADPHRQARVSLGLTVSMAGSGADLLIYRFKLAEKEIDIIEDINFILVRTPHPGRIHGVEQVRAFALLLLKISPNLTFEPRSLSIDDEAAFSSAPFEYLPTLRDWTERIDAGFRRGQLYLMCYKRQDQMLGFSSSQDWFDEKFRRKQKQKSP
jgi:hypothetical protein